MGLTLMLTWELVVSTFARDYDDFLFLKLINLLLFGLRRFFPFFSSSKGVYFAIAMSLLERE